MKDLTKLIRPHLQSLKGYSSAKDDYSGPAKIFLDANENALGSPVDRDLSRYPDPNHTLLRQRWAELRGLAWNQVFFGNGSDEPIDLLIRMFCEPGKDSILTQPPTYGMYRVSAEINGVSVNEAPLTKDFQIDPNHNWEGFSEDNKMIFICTPNNPSGNVLEKEAIEKILNQFEGVVVIDEAYCDFTEQANWSTKLNDYPNLVVLQTMSKAWGMASIRVGVGLAHPEIIKLMYKIKPPYNISGPNQQFALQALQNESEMNANKNGLVAQKIKLMRDLKALKVVEEVYPSDANFLLTKFYDSKSIFKYLTENGIVVRDRGKELYCEGCIRVTVGDQSENEQLLSALSDFKIT